MKIKEIEVKYYRSIGDHGDFRFTSNIVALIGRNESGKTNILDAFNGIRFFEPMGEWVLPMTSLNRYVGGDLSPQVGLLCEFEDADLADIDLPSDLSEEERKAALWVRRDNGRLLCGMSGPFSRRVCEDADLRELEPTINQLLDFVKSNTKRIGWDVALRARFESVLSEHDVRWYPTLADDIEWGLRNIIPYAPEAARKGLTDALSKWRDIVLKIYKKFAFVAPHVLRFDDSRMLKSEYTLNEIKERNFNDVALNRYLGAVKLTRDELIYAFEGADRSKQSSKQDIFRSRTSERIDRFNTHYLNREQKIRFVPHFANNRLTFSVGSVESEETMLLGERSAGLKWYIELFFELERSRNYKNTLILIDEPAVHMHVNAQKEVLVLFDALAKDGRYLVYTTHSPYMVNHEQQGDIRGVVKDEHGIASVMELHKIPSQETLAPLCTVFGVDLANNLGPVAAKKNLVVEGSTDAVYLGAVMPLLIPDENKRPKIIACVSTNNIHSVVSILRGWGCDARAIVDNDCAGQTELKRVRKLFGDSDGAFNHVQPVSEQSEDDIENLISASDYEAAFGVKPTNEELKKSKALKARQFAEKVRGGWRPSEETQEKFRSLLHNLEIV